MAIDFGMEEEQKERTGGPVPAGSKVLLQVTLEKSKYPYLNEPTLTQTKSGLLQLPCRVEVCAGTYQGVYWYENITVQTSFQVINLTKGQQTSAQIGGSLLRAMLESARGIDPKATDPRSCNGRRANTWGDFNGIVFPAKVGINDNGYTGKDGRTYFNNTIGTVIKVTDPDYAKIKQGGEIITNGPTEGKGKSSASEPADTALPWDAPHPASSSYDTVNF